MFFLLKIHKTRSTGKLPPEQMMEEDLKRGIAEKAQGEKSNLTQTGKEPQTTLKSSKPPCNDIEKDGGTRNRSVSKEEPPLQENGEGRSASEQDPKKQKGADKVTARKTVSSSDVANRKLCMKSLIRAKSKTTAHESGPREYTPPSNYVLSNAVKVSRSSNRRNILPIKFEFHRSVPANSLSRRVMARKTVPSAQNEMDDLSSDAPVQPGLTQNGLTTNNTGQAAIQPKQWSTARKSCPTSRNLSQNKSTDIQKGLITNTELNSNHSEQTAIQPKQWSTARKSCPTSRNLSQNKPTDIQKGLTTNTELNSNHSEQTAIQPKQWTTARKSCPTSTINLSQTIQVAFGKSGKINTKEYGGLSLGFKNSSKRNDLEVHDSSPLSKKIKSSSLAVSLAAPSFLPAVQRASVLGLLKSSSLCSNMTEQKSLDNHQADTNVNNQDSKSVTTKNDSKNNLKRPTPQEPQNSPPLKEDTNESIEYSTDITSESDVASSSPETSQADDQEVFGDDDPPKLISSRDLEALDLSGSDETLEMERSPPDIISMEQLQHQGQNHPSSSENPVTSDRDNPTPIPGTTASSSTPPHAQAADFPVGAAGSATPDSSAMETPPPDARKKKKKLPRIATHFGMKRCRSGRHANKPNNYDSGK